MDIVDYYQVERRTTMSNIINEGDTAWLLLNFKLNGEDLQEDAYQEIELQLNPQGEYNAVKKTLSDGSIEWGTVVYTVDDQEETFIGYIALLSQEETFRLRKGKCSYQLRVLVNDEVGSSAIGEVDIGDALSTEVLE